ncbi:hypothetical protein U9M48_016518 [Paspalum notatum var. saurae]|uniref:Sulfotransferase domain-containing protein n=1 Tax=Paspalum notatum var. saurae TaxID=547442 RepID=A0AAQ3T6B3_PASNO
MGPTQKWKRTGFLEIQAALRPSGKHAVGPVQVQPCPCGSGRPPQSQRADGRTVTCPHRPTVVIATDVVQSSSLPSPAGRPAGRELPCPALRQPLLGSEARARRAPATVPADTSAAESAAGLQQATGPAPGSPSDASTMASSRLSSEADGAQAEGAAAPAPVMAVPHTKLAEIIPSLPLETRWPSVISDPLSLRQYNGFWIPEAILKGGFAAIHSCLEPRPSDVFLSSFPKSGTTWLKALAFATLKRSTHPPSEGNHPLRHCNPHDCVKFLEHDLSAGEFEALPLPRVVATHLPYSLLPDSITREGSGSGCRIIYVCRDPKDALVSFWLFLRKASPRVGGQSFTIQEAFELFCQGRCTGGPQWLHVLQYWEASVRRPDSVLFLRYEEMLREPESHLKKLAEFMGCGFSEEEEEAGVVRAIVELCSLGKLKEMEVNRNGVNNWGTKNDAFFRKGVPGDWSNHMTPEMAQRLDTIVEDALQGTGDGRPATAWCAPVPGAVWGRTERTDGRREAWRPESRRQGPGARSPGARLPEEADDAQAEGVSAAPVTAVPHATAAEIIPWLPLETRWPSLSPNPLSLRQYGGFWIPEVMLKSGFAAANSCLEPRPSDVFLSSFPKSGTTWLKALAFATLKRSTHPPSEGNHPLRHCNPHDCIKFLELDLSAGELEALPSPRVVSTHLPYSLLPDNVTKEGSGCRIVYVCRDPKDVLVSFWLFMRRASPSPRVAAQSFTIQEAFELFCQGRCVCGPQWLHVLQYWEASVRRPDSVLFLRYEEMLCEPESHLKKLAEFMSCGFSEEEEEAGVVSAIVELCSLGKLKEMGVNRNGVNIRGTKNEAYFRKGAAGDWSNHMTLEMAQRLDRIVEDALQGTGFTFNLGAQA